MIAERADTPALAVHAVAAVTVEIAVEIVVARAASIAATVRVADHRASAAVTVARRVVASHGKSAASVRHAVVVVNRVVVRRVAADRLHRAVVRHVDRVMRVPTAEAIAAVTVGRVVSVAVNHLTRRVAPLVTVRQPSAPRDAASGRRAVSSCRVHGVRSVPIRAVPTVAATAEIAAARAWVTDRRCRSVVVRRENNRE